MKVESCGGMTETVNASPVGKVGERSETGRVNRVFVLIPRNKKMHTLCEPLSHIA